MTPAHTRDRHTVDSSVNQFQSCQSSRFFRGGRYTSVSRLPHCVRHRLRSSESWSFGTMHAASFRNAGDIQNGAGSSHIYNSSTTIRESNYEGSRVSSPDSLRGSSPGNSPLGSSALIQSPLILPSKDVSPPQTVVNLHLPLSYFILLES